MDKSVTYEKCEMMPDLTYNYQDRCFKYRGIDIDIKEAVSLADRIMELITGEPFVLSEMLTLEELEDESIIHEKIAQKRTVSAANFVKIK